VNELSPHRHHIFIVINCMAFNSIVRVILEYETSDRRQAYV
jgi:hypothetical protein